MIFNDPLDKELNLMRVLFLSGIACLVIIPTTVSQAQESFLANGPAQADILRPRVDRREQFRLSFREKGGKRIDRNMVKENGRVVAPLDFAIGREPSKSRKSQFDPRRKRRFISSFSSVVYRN